MKMTTKLLAWSAAAFLGAVAASSASRAQADEKVVKEDEVPKAAREALEKKYPKCTVKKWQSETDEGKTVYEATIEAKAKGEDGKELTRKIDVGLSAEGKILAEEERMSQDKLPDAVKKAWADSKYAKAKVKRVERVVKEEKDDQAEYEFGAELDGKKVEVVLDKTGKITKEEAEDEDEDEGAEKGAGMGGEMK